MLVGSFRAAVAWNASFLDRQPCDMIAEYGLYAADISWSVGFVRAFPEDLDDIATIVRKSVSKSVSVGSLVNVKDGTVSPTPC